MIYTLGLNKAPYVTGPRRYLRNPKRVSPKAINATKAVGMCFFDCYGAWFQGLGVWVYVFQIWKFSRTLGCSTLLSDLKDLTDTCRHMGEWPPCSKDFCFRPGCLGVERIGELRSSHTG